ncbi:hypothetical protein MKW92_023141, partial [Papaver armeniacum]
MENGSEIRSIIEELCLTIRVTPSNSNQQQDVSSQDHKTPSSTALRSHKVGTSMLVLRQDVHQNIERLEKFLESDPLSFGNVVEILKKEATERSARKVSSCTRALVWLARSMDFLSSFVRKISGGSRWQSMKQVREESYNISLRLQKTFFINLLMSDQDQKDSSDLLAQEIKSLTDSF